MTHYISPQQGIKELVSELEAGLSDLARRMRFEPDRMRIDYCASIPYRETAEVDSSESIPVSTLADQEAIERIISGLTAIRIEAGRQHPRETLRVPGVVALPSDWMQELSDMNLIKAEIEQLIGSIDEQYKRMQVWRSMPYLSSLQCMRQSWIIDAPRSIRFYWDCVPSVKPSTAKKEILKCEDFLTKQFGYVPTLAELPSDDRNLKYLFAINDLETIPADENVAIYRPGKPSIRSRITFVDPEHKAVIRSTPAPIIYSIEHPAPTITALQSWEPEQSTKSRSSRVKIEQEPFVESLFIHRYLPPYRFSK